MTAAILIDTSETGRKMQTQILRLTTPKLKYVWGPVRSE
jgi:hypothetical protein